MQHVELVPGETHWQMHPVLPVASHGESTGYFAGGATGSSGNA